MFADLFLLILTSYAKFELNSLRMNEITVKLLITDIFGCHDKSKVRNDIILNPNQYGAIMPPPIVFLSISGTT